MSIDAFTKRAIDLALAIPILAALLILGPLVALAIVIDSRGPVFFKCKRLGRHGRPIEIIKFRTMAAGAPEKFAPDGSRIVEARDARVTRLGRLLRIGFDELPQVLNVLRGELSFVGPRPDDIFATSLYKGADWLKLAAMPGLTGFAQVNGRTELAYADRLQMEAFYAAHRTLRLDCRIAFETALQLVGLAKPKALVPMTVVRAFHQSPEALAAAEEVRRRWEASQ